MNKELRKAQHEPSYRGQMALPEAGWVGAMAVTWRGLLVVHLSRNVCGPSSARPRGGTPIDLTHRLSSGPVLSDWGMNSHPAAKSLILLRHH